MTYLTRLTSLATPSVLAWSTSAFLSGAPVRVKGRGILGIAMTPPDRPLIAAVEGDVKSPSIVT